MIYRFIPGRVCTPADLQKEAVWRGVAARLGQWHATLPVVPAVNVREAENNQIDLSTPLSPVKPVSSEEVNAITPHKVVPNVWTIMHKWIRGLPAQ